MFTPNPILSCDFYKVGHVFQYPQGTEYIYSNFTARNGKHFENQNKVKPEGVVFWKLQAFLQELNDNFDENFFGRPKYEVVAEYKRRTDGALGTGAMIFTINLSNTLMVWFAPKIWLIKEIAALIK